MREPDGLIDVQWGQKVTRLIDKPHVWVEHTTSPLRRARNNHYANEAAQVDNELFGGKIENGKIKRPFY